MSLGAQEKDAGSGGAMDSILSVLQPVPHSHVFVPNGVRARPVVTRRTSSL